MKKIIWVVALGFLFSGTAWGMEKNQYKDKVKKSSGYNNPVEVKAIGFSAEYSNGKVETSWKEYLRSDLKYYKLVKSSTNPNPVYPEDGYIFYSSNPGDTSYSDSKVKPGSWYYRLCVITENGDRWVSPVVKVKVKSSDLSQVVPTTKDFR